MPIAMVIASRNSFHVISDTLAQNSDDTFTINAQKVFYSTKHRLALCISEGLALPPDTPQSESEPVIDSKECHSNQILHANFIIKDFFNYLDHLKSVRLKNLLTKLENFLETHYDLSYKKAFLSWIDFFYGGFNDQGITTICEYRAKSRKVRRHVFSDDSKEDQFFSNLKKSIKKFIYPNIAENITGNDLLKTTPFFSFTMRHIIKKANSSHRNFIGPYLDYVKIRRNGESLTRKIQYSDADVVIFDTKQFPAYLLYKSEEDSEKAMERGELITYHAIADLKNKPVIYTPMPEEPSQSSSSVCHATAHPYSGDETFHSDFTIEPSLGNIYSPSSVLSTSPVGSSRFASSEETIQALQFFEPQTDVENETQNSSIDQPHRPPGFFEKTFHFIKTHPLESMLGTAIILMGGIVIKNSIFKTNSNEPLERANSQPQL